MKSITIHGLDHQLDKLIRKRAKKHGISLNKTMKNLLEESLGIKKLPDYDHSEDFMDLFGTWSEEDKKKFDESISELDKIDEKDWR